MTLHCLECDFTASVPTSRIAEAAPGDDENGDPVAWAVEYDERFMRTYFLQDKPIVCPMHDVRRRTYEEMPWLRVLTNRGSQND